MGNRKQYFLQFSLWFLIILLGWAQPMALAGMPPAEKIRSGSAGFPSGWITQGTWHFTPVFRMALASGVSTKVKRELQGDGHVLARFAGSRDKNLSYGCLFSFSGGSITLERQVLEGDIYIVMDLRQKGKSMGKKKRRVSAGDLDIMLQRKEDTFLGWVAGTDENFIQVGSLKRPDVSQMIDVGVQGRTTGGADTVTIKFLEVVGIKPEVTVMRRDEVFKGYKTSPSPKQGQAVAVVAQGAKKPIKAVQDKPRSPDGRFTDNLDGTVTDAATGRMWTQKDSFTDLKHCVNWEAGQNYVLQLRTGGYNDWRLPTIEEVSALYDRSKSLKDYKGIGIALDPIFAAGGSFWYWTSHKNDFLGFRQAAIVNFRQFEVYKSHWRKECKDHIGARAVRP